ncbi:hypothetical protein QAD02_007406 [Eretmocerus hayati]|uniref:Uncharacterized protein n=1 Tax=Eretmocerus hayati TaxID=131215 RepID=A0ACC2N3V4_9HYME|nr:hypothetical protein QAD02_007406 [Eretmocerus hayati]
MAKSANTGRRRSPTIVTGTPVQKQMVHTIPKSIQGWEMVRALSAQPTFPTVRQPICRKILSAGRGNADVDAQLGLKQQKKRSNASLHAHRQDIDINSEAAQKIHLTEAGTQV